MSSVSFSRLAARTQPSLLRRPQAIPRHLPPLKARGSALACCQFSTTVSRASGGAGDEEESFEQFTARYENEFNNVQDVFELQRNLNNAFAYDLVPSVSVIAAALKAARRVNDFPTAVRVFEGIKVKVENRNQYHAYLRELKGIREELGINLKEDLYPGVVFSSNRDKEDWLPDEEKKQTES